MNVILEDLEINNYRIYQDKDSFNFGIDAVFLSNFALKNIGYISKSKLDKTNDINKFIDKNVLNICDFCTGDLPIPLIMYAKRAKFIDSNIKIVAFEIEKEQVLLCEKSLLWNYENVLDAKNILEDIKIINDDIKNIYNNREKYKKYYEKFDVITCNPPYIKKGSGIVNKNDKKMVARHEIFITFEEICRAASLLLKSNKKFYIVHHSERLTEISRTLSKYFFEIKKIQFIHPSIDKPSHLVLIEAVKNAKSGIKVLEPIIL